MAPSIRQNLPKSDPTIETPIKPALLICSLIILALSILGFLLDGAGVASAVTGGGRVNSSVDGLFMLAKALFALAISLGIAGWLIPPKRARRDRAE